MSFFHSRMLAGVGATALLCLTATAGSAAPGIAVGPLEKVTGSSPFAGCSADKPNTQDGLLFKNSEIEPWVEVNPTDPDNLIAVWQQDRWSNGGSRGLVSGYSPDAGKSWFTSIPGGTSACTGGPFSRGSDPWVSFGPDGTAFFNTLLFEPDLPTGEFGANALYVSKSRNGGRTWGRPISVVEDPAGQALNDKNSITADPTDGRFVYVVWDRLVDFGLRGGLELPTEGGGDDESDGRVPGKKGAADGLELARALSRAMQDGTVAAVLPGHSSGGRDKVYFEGPALIARSTDGGETYAPATTLFDPGPNAQTIANQIVVQPNGKVFNFFTNILPGFSRFPTLSYVSSSDHGATWDAVPTNVARMATFGVVTPDLQDPVRDASILFDVAVDPSSGKMAVVWQDYRFRGVEEVLFSMSDSAGQNWTAPTRINLTPANARNVLRQQAFVPSIVALGDGSLVVTYYDFRNDHGGPVEGTDYWAIVCQAGDDCTAKSSWSEVRLTNSTFDMALAPIARGHFLGDYQGLTAVGGSAIAVFGIATEKDKTNLYARRVSVPTVAPVASSAP